MNSAVNKLSSGLLLTLGWLLRFLGYALLVLLAVGTLGCFATFIPVLGSMGPLFISPNSLWVTMLSLIGAVVVFRRWRKTAKRRTLIPLLCAAFAAIGTIVIQAQQLNVAKINGIDIDLTRTLGLSREQPGGAAPLLQTYSTYQGQDLPLAIYPLKTAQGQSLAPVIVYVHGGGWGGGSLHDRPGDMYWFADQGYLVISVEYTLSSAERPTWNIAPAQVGCALGWIADNAARFGGDASRITLFGESAGGNLVLNVSYQANAGLLQPSCEGKLPHIAATIAGYPIVDALRMYQNADVIAGGFAKLMTTHYTGGTPEQYPDRYAAVSSATHIHPAAPPTLLLPGLADNLLPPEPVYSFAAQAQAAGVEARVIAFPYGQHSFDQRSGSIGSQLFRRASLQFLAQQGLAP